jgi:hypothetical protein
MSWIKIDNSLAQRPEVLQIKRLCKLKDVQECMGRLTAVWIFADQNSTDGVIHGVSIDVIDEVSGCAGFGTAMCEVGWLQDGDGITGNGTLTFPNWFRHHSSSAKERALNARRMNELRHHPHTIRTQSAHHPHKTRTSSAHKPHKSPPRIERERE